MLRKVSAELAKVRPSAGSLVQALYYLTRMVLKGPCGGETEHDYLLRMVSRSRHGASTSGADQQEANCGHLRG